MHAPLNLALNIQMLLDQETRVIATHCSCQLINLSLLTYIFPFITQCEPDIQERRPCLPFKISSAWMSIRTMWGLMREQRNRYSPQQC